jgi:hypothetical protein
MQKPIVMLCRDSFDNNHNNAISEEADRLILVGRSSEDIITTGICLSSDDALLVNKIISDHL